MDEQDSRIDQDFAFNGLGLSTPQHLEEAPRHRWYYVKEAFSHRLVEAAIDSAGCTPGDLIVDPFAGSGTVAVVAAARHVRSINVEVNPFLAFVARSKLRQVSSGDYRQATASVETGAMTGSPSTLESFSTFSEGGGASKWLFNTSVLQSFEGGWQASSSLAGPVRDLTRLALLGAALDSCNAVRDGKCLRYRRDWQTRHFGAQDFVRAFLRRSEHMESDLVKCAIDQEGIVRNGDARDALRDPIADGFRLCVTSPPYLNSFDYSDVYRPEMFLGKFVSSNAELTAIRLKTLRSHVQVGWELPHEDAFGQRYSAVIEDVISKSDALWDKRIPHMIQAYFEDIKKVLSALHRQGAPGAAVWLVVSTSAYAGIEIPVDSIIADVAESVGWHIEQIGLLRYLRSSGQHWNRLHSNGVARPRLRETVVIMKKGLNT